MVNVKWPQKVQACLGFLAQISCGGHEGTNSHSESQKLFNCKGTGICNWTWPLKFLWPFQSKMEKKEKPCLFSDLFQEAENIVQMSP